MIAHSSEDFNNKNIHNHRLYTLRLHCWGKFKFKSGPLKTTTFDYSISWRIISSSSSYNSSSKRCNLCLKEKFLIICRPNLSSLNKRNELMYLLAATETKRCYVTIKNLNLNFPQKCNLKVYSRWL